MLSYWMLALVTGYGIVTVLSICPTNKSVKDRVDATEAVKRNVRRVFSKLFRHPIVVSNSRSADFDVYERIATGVGLSPTLSGFAQFQEAISEVAIAKYHADLKIESNTSIVTTEYISELKEDLMVSTAVKNTDMAREVFGEMICIESL